MDKDFEKRYIAARRRVVEADFQSLNPMQREAVLATEGPLLVLAGAGSGKTTVLINRVANLLKYGRASDTDEVPESATEADLAVLEAGPSDEARRLAAFEPVEPWRIIAITFTNKAADELKARLEAMLGERANDIWARTFHSACVRILRRDADKLGYPRDFTIYDTSDRLSIMKSIIREMDLDDKVYPPQGHPRPAGLRARRAALPRGLCRQVRLRLGPAAAEDRRDIQGLRRPPLLRRGHGLRGPPRC